MALTIILKRFIITSWNKIMRYCATRRKLMRREDRDKNLVTCRVCGKKVPRVPPSGYTRETAEKIGIWCTKHHKVSRKRYCKGSGLPGAEYPHVS
jgi:hypothetical protein